METLSRLPQLFHMEKSNKIYSSYKYQDLKPEWIIHEGNLEYLYSETMFKTSCKFIFNKKNKKSLNFFFV